MNTRRQFIQKTITFFTAIGVCFNPATSWIKSAYAKAKRILVPRGTEMKSLIREDPAELDTLCEPWLKVLTAPPGRSM